MKIGVFDSGLGGLLITRSLTYTLPEYDYLYLGDTAHLPYGNRSQESIYQLTRRAVLYLCKEGCGLIIIACNTASAEALRRIQQYDIPAAFPDRRVLGVLVPAAEAAVTAAGQHGQIGILATASTVRSGAYLREIQKLAPAMIIRQQEAPLLVPLIENNEPEQIEPVLNRYLEPLIARPRVDCLILGCTHYSLLKDRIRDTAGPSVTVVSQDEVIPEKLRLYLERHPEIDGRLSRNGSRDFRVTDPRQPVRTPAFIYTEQKITTVEI